MATDHPHRPTGDESDRAPSESPGAEELARLDDMALRAGHELRRPAPAHGLAAVHQSRRRRRAGVLTASGAAVVAVGVGLTLLATRDPDATVVSDQTDTTVPTETNPTETNPTETVPAEIVPAETVPAETVATNAPTAPSTETSQATDVDSVPTPTTAPATSPTTEPTTSTPGASVPAVRYDPDDLAPADEQMLHPLAVGSDGFVRALNGGLDGGDLVVHDERARVITLDVPEPWRWLYGVGPDDVAYLRLEDLGSARIVAVPTTGPAVGTVYELVPSFSVEGPWAGFMTRTGIDVMDNAADIFVPYVDAEGRELEPSVDPSFTWVLDYQPVEGVPSVVRPVLTDPAGAEHPLPVTEPSREGQWERDVRPLPDGRVAVDVVDDGGVPVVWVLDPSSGEWEVYLRGEGG